MSKLAWIALCGLVAVAGCTSNTRGTSGDRDRASGGASSATTAPAGREDMRGSKDVAPGAEGDRERPRGSAAPSRGY